MTGEIADDHEAAIESLSDAYREAVGSVMAARTLYDQACGAHGADSWAAKQAQDYLNREITHRNTLRTQYDQVIDHPRTP